jgi:hypothetical protein
MQQVINCTECVARVARRLVTVACHVSRYTSEDCEMPKFLKLGKTLSQIPGMSSGKNWSPTLLWCDTDRIRANSGDTQTHRQAEGKVVSQASLYMYVFKLREVDYKITIAGQFDLAHIRPSNEMVLKQFHPTSILTSYFPQIYIDIIHLYHLPFKWAFPKSFPTKTHCTFLRFSNQVMRANHPSFHYPNSRPTWLSVGLYYVNDQAPHFI